MLLQSHYLFSREQVLFLLDFTIKNFLCFLSSNIKCHGVWVFTLKELGKWFNHNILLFFFDLVRVSKIRCKIQFLQHYRFITVIDIRHNEGRFSHNGVTRWNWTTQHHPAYLQITVHDKLKSANSLLCNRQATLS